MTDTYLHALVLELRATAGARLPATTGHQAHACFLDLIAEVDPARAARLHDEPDYRPFTVAPLEGGRPQGAERVLRAGDPARLRLTLLDGGDLWRCLAARALAPGPLRLRLGEAEFVAERLLATPEADPTGWAGWTTWAALAATPAARRLTLHFATPTAFNLGDKQFALFPEPRYVWDSFLRVWNRYAPATLAFDKAALRACVAESVVVADYTLRTTCLHYPRHIQKGFLGTCTYLVRADGAPAAQIAALAAFARYAGAGYKTTMGMGQVCCAP